MNSKFCHDSEMTSRRSGIESLMLKCPICGREFSCNKTYHVYTAFACCYKAGNRLSWQYKNHSAFIVEWFCCA